MYITEAEEIDDSVESDGRDRLLGVGFHFWFGVEGDSESGEVEHREVVGAISDGDDLFEVYLFDLCDEVEQFRFPLSVDDVAEVFAGQLTVFDFQLVGVDIVYPETFLEILAEIGEAAGKDGDFEATFFKYGHQTVGSVHDR